MNTHTNIEDRLDRTDRLLKSSAIDDALRAELDTELADCYSEFIALQSDDAFEQHMARFVADAYEARQNGERDPLCTCTLPMCALKQGELPAPVRYSSKSIFSQPSGRKRVLSYLHKHSGGEVLHELLDEWDRKEGELRKAIASIQSRATMAMDAAKPDPEKFRHSKTETNTETEVTASE